MKFTVREGFAVRHQYLEDAGDGRKELREVSYWPTSKAFELEASAADAHAHKLVGADKEGIAYLEAKVRPVDSATQMGITPEMLAMAKALAGEMAAQIVAASKPAA